MPDPLEPPATMNVRMVVAGIHDRRVVGTLLHPDLDVIVGTVPGTPAAKLDDHELSAIIGYPWATEVPQVTDGQARVAAIKRLTQATDGCYGRRTRR